MNGLYFPKQKSDTCNPVNMTRTLQKQLRLNKNVQSVPASVGMRDAYTKVLFGMHAFCNQCQKRGKEIFFTFLYYHSGSKNKVVNLNYSTSEKNGITPVPDVLLYYLVLK